MDLQSVLKIVSTLLDDEEIIKQVYLNCASGKNDFVDYV